MAKPLTTGDKRNVIKAIIASLLLAAAAWFGKDQLPSSAPVPAVTNSVPVITNVVETPPPAVISNSVGPTLVKVWCKSSRVVGFKVENLKDWPVDTNGKKDILGIMRCNGKKFDWVSVDNAKTGVKTADNLYGTKYGQDIKKGQTVQIDITDINGKSKTNPLPLVWEWENTRNAGSIPIVVSILLAFCALFSMWWVRVQAKGDHPS